MKKQIVITLIICAGMIASAYVVSRFYLRVRKEEAIAVKGVAERELKADVGKLRFDVVDQDPILSNAVVRVRTQYAEILQQIESEVGSAVEVFRSEPAVRRIMKVADNGRDTDELAYFMVSSSCSITTKNVQIIPQVASILTDYASRNVQVQSDRPQYMISNLQEVKLELLEEAMQDGRRRAKALAQGEGVGKLVAANQGVFQITAPLSTESSWYGEYDTSTVKKRIKAVVSLKYEVK